MRRNVVAALTLALALVAGSARADTFAVLPALQGLPGADQPNVPGELQLAPSWTLPPAVPEQLSSAQLEALWQRAGAAYGIPWQVLGAINKIESNFGRNMGPSSAGAIGWMQFMPSTWLRWGTDANGDGIADPWNAEDAIFSAARYLAASGGATDIAGAIYSYNHADWYLREVLDLAQVYGQSGAVAFTLDRLQVRLQDARREVVAVNRRLVAARAVARKYGRVEARLRTAATRATLLSDRLAADKRATLAEVRHAGADAAVSRLRARLEAAQGRLADARAASQPASFSAGAAAVLQAPTYDGGYVFPVGGGPQVVSAAHTHHDYPAVDIAAPSGSPAYALADSVVLRAWRYPDPRCGIGLTLRAFDGQVWTYCHLAYEEPSVVPGAHLAAGAPVGLVGATGDATGPHLHLQLQPPTRWPQQEAWFASFAGTAFSWQDAPTPTQQPESQPQQTVTAPPVAMPTTAAPAQPVRVPAAVSTPALPKLPPARQEGEAPAFVAGPPNAVLFTR